MSRHGQAIPNKTLNLEVFFFASIVIERSRQALETDQQSILRKHGESINCFINVFTVKWVVLAQYKVYLVLRIRPVLYVAFQSHRMQFKQ